MGLDLFVWLSKIQVARQKNARTRLTNLTGLVVGQWNEAASP